MFKTVEDISEVIDFIKTDLHRHIPSQLWNSQLWLYDKIINHTDSIASIRNSNGNSSRFYVDKINNRVKGIAYCEIFSDYISLLLESDHIDHLEALIYSVRSKFLMPVRVYVIREDLAIKLENHIKFKSQSDYSKYMYITNNTDALNQVPNSDFRKLDKEQLNDIKLPSRLSKAYDSAIFYGKYLNKSPICVCSIIPISGDMAEILDVTSLSKDYSETDNISELIKFSILMLKDIYTAFSIKVDVEDHNMVKTLESLGFIEMYREYFIDIE